MNIANSTAVNTAVTQTQGETADAVNLLVLRKALDVQQDGAMALLNALPQPPALAAEGGVGRHLNTYA
ncbi:YjfB family protein [Roseateles sp. NT4]|uniref:YjfB family protein n=1 Tax=Roseateles sp. NT4 TaxID=3453715 RepID=UPI003EE9508C